MATAIGGASVVRVPDSSVRTPLQEIGVLMRGDLNWQTIRIDGSVYRQIVLCPENKDASVQKFWIRGDVDGKVEMILTIKEEAKRSRASVRLASYIRFCEISALLDSAGNVHIVKPESVKKFLGLLCKDGLIASEVRDELLRNVTTCQAISVKKMESAIFKGRVFCHIPADGILVELALSVLGRSEEKAEFLKSQMKIFRESRVLKSQMKIFRESLDS